MTGPPRRRRLAVVSDAVYPWNTGGKEVRHHEILTRLVSRGFDVDVYTMRWWDTPDDHVICDGVTYIALCRRMSLYVDGRRSIVQAAVFSLASLRLVRREFDVLEADAIPFLHLFPLRIVASLRRRPMVVTWHEFWGQRYWIDYLGPLGFIAAFIERSALRIPTRIIAASSGTAARLQAAGGPSVEVRVIPNGVGHAVNPTPNDASGAPHQEVTDLLVVGRLLSHKKVDSAIAALAILRDRGRQVTLGVIGEGPEEASLRSLVGQLELGAAVSFAGFVSSHDELLERMRTSRVLVFPSIREGFGMVAVEAMSVGVPVVTSDHADNFAQHLVSDGVNGAVTSAEPAALALAIERVLDNREQMSQAAFATARGYDWDVLADEAAAVYAGGLR